MATFYIEQFGCRATQADGAALEHQLRERGCTPVSAAKEADFVVVNTCTVTAAADSQARDSIRGIHLQNPHARVIVTGCYAQRAPEELAALPGVHWVVGNSHKPDIPDLMKDVEAFAPNTFVPVSALNSLSISSTGASVDSARRKILCGDIFEQTSLLVAPIVGGEGHHTRPILKIQDGCNSRCSYCVIPFVRGKSRSLPPNQVIEEIRKLSEAGFREVVLSGINIGTYGRDLTPRIEFIDLLQRILDETSLERLRVSSIEPLDVTKDLIALFASTDRIAQHFHMPLQSGSDRILAAMRRWYRAEHYARRAELIREHLPNAAIGADVIAGFPGEDDADHHATLEFIDRHPFTYLHVFSFSSRPGTSAANLPNHLSASVVKQRARDLRKLGESKAAAFRRSQLDRTLRALTLHRDDSTPNDCTPAITSNYIRVLAKGIYPANVWLDTSISVERNDWLVGKSAS